MPQIHVIRQQDCLSSVAAAHGLLPATIWDDAGNADLRKRRKNPNALAPGDELVIPDLRCRQESAASAARHRYRRKGVPEKLRIRLEDETGEPRAALPYTAIIDGVHSEGQTDADGRLEISIPPAARDGRLLLGEAREEIHELALGGIDPIDTLSGAQQRLDNLGYACDRLDGALDATTVDALREFQATYELDVTGRYDEATQAKLEEVHGC
ncbi:MAG: peptidoglycan-binding protein [Planctomycetes bacterium]|nr:peptidoglycan-binding protein [Planctomycetota bacterium]